MDVERNNRIHTLLEPHCRSRHMSTTRSCRSARSGATSGIPRPPASTRRSSTRRGVSSGDGDFVVPGQFGAMGIDEVEQKHPAAQHGRRGRTPFQADRCLYVLPTTIPGKSSAGKRAPSRSTSSTPCAAFAPGQESTPLDFVISDIPSLAGPWPLAIGCHDPEVSGSHPNLDNRSRCPPCPRKRQVILPLSKIPLALASTLENDKISTEYRAITQERRTTN